MFAFRLVSTRLYIRMSFIQCTCLVLVWLSFSGMCTIADSTDNKDCEEMRANRNKILTMGVFSDKLAIVTNSDLAYVLDLDSSVSLESNGHPIVTIKQKPSLDARKHLAGFKEKPKLKVDPAVKYFLYSSKIDGKTTFYIGAFYGHKIGPFGSCLVLFDLHDNNYKRGDRFLCKALSVDYSQDDLSAIVVSDHIIRKRFSIAHFYVFHPSDRKFTKMVQLNKLSKHNIHIHIRSTSEFSNVSQYWHEADYPTCAFYLAEKLVLIYSDGSIEMYHDEDDMLDGINKYEINVSQFIQCQVSTATTAATDESDSEESKDNSIVWFVSFTVFIIFALLAMVYYKMYRAKARKKDKKAKRRRKINQLEEDELMESNLFDSSSQISTSSHKASFYADSLPASSQISKLSSGENFSTMPQSDIGTLALPSSTVPVSVKGPKSTVNSKLAKSPVQSKSPTLVSPKSDATKSPSTVSAKEPKSSPKHELSKSQVKPKSPSTASQVTSSKPSANKSKTTSQHVTSSRLESIKKSLFKKILSAFQRQPQKRNKNKKGEKKQDKQNDK